MPILTYGINHKSAPIEIREKIAYDPTRTCETLQELLHKQSVNEAILLSTCNRTEIYTTSQFRDPIQQWLISKHNHPKFDISSFCYDYHGIDAVRHLLRVASGLDSMVLGEPQILGQVKEAYRLACEMGTAGKQLQHLFQTIFAASKQIRYSTDIGKNSVSMAYAIVQLAKKIFNKLERCKILLIGAGQIIELIATYLKSCGIQKMVIANRSFEKAYQLAHNFQAQAIGIADIPIYLKESDIIISATASPLPIIGKGMMESALKAKRRKPRFMVDLAVPRDIEPEIAELEDVYLYNLDDLQHVLNENLKNREQAAKQAEEMIDIQATHYMRMLRILDAKDMIRGYRQQLETLRDKELIKAREKLQRGHDPEMVLQYLGHNLVNKIMHNPTIKIKKAAYNERLDMLLMAKDLFDVE